MPDLHQHPSLEPVVLDRYRLVHRLGSGAGGETWRAVPVDGGSPVAIKIVAHAGIPSRETADLLREAALLQSLRHPHIVRYLGVADLPGSLSTFLIMEYVEGGNFSDWTDQHRPCSAADTVPLLLQITDALSFLHSCGVLHRDLKPANVLVRPVPGAVPVLLVADFGIARPIRGGIASEMRPAGTPGYSPPETWRGLEVSAAADVYSLGAIAWHCLVGPRATAETEGRTGGDSGLRRTLARKVGNERDPLVDVVVRMLSERPEDRPTLDEVRRGLVPARYRTDHGCVPTSPSIRMPPLPPSPDVDWSAGAPTAGGWVSAPEVPEPTPTFLSERQRRSNRKPVEDFGVWFRLRRTLGGAVAGLAYAACFFGFGWWVKELYPDAVLANSSRVNVTSGVEAPASSLSSNTAAPGQELLAATGEIAQLLVTVEPSISSPEHGQLVVTTAGNDAVRTSQRQLTLSNVRSGEARVELWAQAQRLALAAVQLPPGLQVHVACRAFGLPADSIACEVRRDPDGQ